MVGRNARELLIEGTVAFAEGFHGTAKHRSGGS